MLGTYTMMEEEDPSLQYGDRQYCKPRQFRRNFVMSCIYTVPSYVGDKSKALYAKFSDPSRLSERLLTTNHGEKPPLRFPVYYSLNLKKNVEFINVTHGLELRHLTPCEVPYWEQGPSHAAFHVRLSPSSAKQGFSMPLLIAGDSLDLTDTRTGGKRKIQIDNYDAAPLSSTSLAQARHGILWGMWINEMM
jgi:hypothetical protein